MRKLLNKYLCFDINQNSILKYLFVFILVYCNDVVCVGQTPSQAIPEILNEPLKKKNFSPDTRRVLPNANDLNFSPWGLI